LFVLYLVAVCQVDSQIWN